jgi:hypothetical protein
MTNLWSKITSPQGRFDGMKEAVNSIISQGYPLSAILSQLHDDVIEHSLLTDTDKALICEKLAQVWRILFYEYHFTNNDLSLLGGTMFD